MTDKELWAEIQADDSDEELKKELQRKLFEEMDKPICEQNFEYIDELTKTLDMITGEDRITSERTAHGIQMLYNKIKMIRRKKRIKVAQRFAVCVCAVLVVSNIWTFSAFGINAFSAVFQVLNGGITIDFSKQESSMLETDNPYAEEMRQICNENNIEAIIPSYLPSGFQPTENYGINYDAKNGTSVFFYFKNKDSKLNIQITQYDDNTDPPPLGIATDHYNLTEQILNGTTVYISKEEKQYTSAFMIDNTQYLLAADGLDYSECQRVLESMFNIMW